MIFRAQLPALVTPEKPVVGIMTPLPVFGSRLIR